MRAQCARSARMPRRCLLPAGRPSTRCRAGIRVRVLRGAPLASAGGACCQAARVAGQHSGSCQLGRFRRCDRRVSTHAGVQGRALARAALPAQSDPRACAVPQAESTAENKSKRASQMEKADVVKTPVTVRRQRQAILRILRHRALLPRLHLRARRYSRRHLPVPCRRRRTLAA